MKKISSMEFIDILRHKNYISINDFCDGIVGERQYYKYINGHAKPSSITIELFITEKLKMKMSEFYILYEKHTETINA